MDLRAQDDRVELARASGRLYLEVFIVAQPQSGLVLAKSFYRIIGTVVGAAGALLVVSLFSQERVLFLRTLAAWIGLCTFASKYARNFAAYGFVLSGYTVAIVGIPGALDPGNASFTAVARVTEISLGIMAAAAISHLVLPVSLADSLRIAVASGRTELADHAATLHGGGDTTSQRTKLLSQVNAIESPRASAILRASGRMRTFLYPPVGGYRQSAWHQQNDLNVRSSFPFQLFNVTYCPEFRSARSLNHALHTRRRWLVDSVDLDQRLNRHLVGQSVARVPRPDAKEKRMEMKTMTAPTSENPFSAWQPNNPVSEYWVDAWQRGLLFLDVLRQRGNSAAEHNAREAPNALSFAAELVLDGRKLERPVNYGLVRIVPPPGSLVDDGKRPFIVFDPRAGHGPGIGGMKHDSEIGEALAAGHPCYFVGFLPNPVPGQTVEDVCRAEARFIEAVAALHPNSGRKPALIANCQAGWQIMMTSAIRPDLAGPILLAGSPLSYWAGTRGQSPMRYLGGLLGGTWLTSLAGDLGGGIFDGANLVTNFEAMHPDNTLWKKSYNVYSKVDTEAPRYLEFEKWWGSPVLLNAEEMQYIADNLFVGNKLSNGQLRTSDGVRIDLRNIRSPIIVFCSWGDDITPPPQALDWIVDLYDHEDEIVANGQTIVYTLHQTIGHLGIFVSGQVATKEHSEFVQCMDLIDLMPPGLYEAVITEVGADAANPELVHGRYLFALERRTVNDIRALGGNDAEDDRCFATAARVSEVNQGLYRSLASPAVLAAVTPKMAETTRQMHPDRLRFSLFSDRNPWMAAVGPLADAIRQDRHPADRANPLLSIEHLASEWIAMSLKLWGNARDALTEQIFHAVYGSPMLQALVGLSAENTEPHQRVERDVAREAAANRARAELESAVDHGGSIEAFVRALMYIAGPTGRVDDRGHAALQEVGRMLPPEQHPGFARFKEIVRQQFLILHLDEERAVEAFPKLAVTAGDRRLVLESLRRLIAIQRVKLTEEQQRRLARVETLLAIPAAGATRRERVMAED